MDDMDTALNATAHAVGGLLMQKEQSGDSLLPSPSTNAIMSSSNSEINATAAAAAVVAGVDLRSLNENTDSNKTEAIQVTAASASSSARRKTISTINKNRHILDSIEGSKGGRRDVSPSPGTRMLIYSGHDSTMVPLLKAIGLYKGTVHWSRVNNQIASSSVFATVNSSLRLFNFLYELFILLTLFLLIFLLSNVDVNTPPIALSYAISIIKVSSWFSLLSILPILLYSSLIRRLATLCVIPNNRGSALEISQ